MSIARCAEVSSIDPAMGHDFYRLVLATRPHRMLEIGTCIGISALYLILAARDVGTLSRFVTLEGGDGLAAVARDNLASLGFEGEVATVVAGRHAETLPAALASLRPVDFAFVDGSHIGEEVLQQHVQIAAASADEATLVFDDITWSASMRAAWAEIHGKGGIFCTIDCGRYGVALLDRAWKDQPLRLSRDG
jgi:predicted O-methyltransferase YrrM